MIDLVKALRSRATWETAIGFTEPHQHINWMAAEEITRLREENARLMKENSELMLRAHALLWLLPPEITCGELRKARDEMLAATIREGDKG